MDGLERNDALSELLRHSDWMRSLARSLVKDESGADDLVQRTWLAAARNPPSRPGRPRAWLGLVMRRTLLREHRRRAREDGHLARLAAAHGEQRVDGAERLRLHRELVDEVLALDAPYREVVVLRYFDELGRREMAARLGIPEETVKTRLRRALARLRRRLRGRHGGEDWRLCVLAAVGLGNVPVRGTASATAAMLTSGAAIMSTTAKTAVGVLILAAAVTGWLRLRDDGAEPELRGGPDAREIDTSGLGVEQARRAPAVNDEPPSGAASPPDVRVPAAAAAAAPEATPCIVSGRVVDEAGRAVPGASVYWATASNGPRIRTLEDFCYEVGTIIAAAADASSAPSASVASRMRHSVEADSSGRFRLEPGTDTGILDLAAYHVDVGPGVKLGLVLEEASTDSSLTIALRRGHVFEGDVRDTAGRPVAGADISLGGGAGDAISAIGRVISDAGGHYRTWPLPFSHHLHTCTKSGYFREQHAATPGADERVVRLDFELTPSPWLEGRLVEASGEDADVLAVVDRVRGESAREPWLREHRLVLWGGWSLEGERRPRPTPEYRLDLERARYRVCYPSRSVRWIALNAGEVTVAKAAVESLETAPDLVIDPSAFPETMATAPVTVRVIDSEGSPVPRYGLEWWVLSDGAVARPLRGMTHAVENENGELRLPDCACRPSRLVVHAEGFAPASRRLVPRAETDPVVVVMRRVAGDIRGHVRRADGTPLPAVFVHALEKTPSGWTSPPAVTFLTTDSRGRYKIPGLPPGEYLVVIDADGLVIPPGLATVTGGTARCDLDAAPTVEVSIRPRGVEGPMQFVVTDRRGRVVYDDRLRGRSMSGGGPLLRIPRGPYVLEVLLPSGERHRLDFDAAAGAVVEFEP